MASDPNSLTLRRGSDWKVISCGKLVSGAEIRLEIEEKFLDVKCFAKNSPNINLKVAFKKLKLEANDTGVTLQTDGLSISFSASYPRSSEFVEQLGKKLSTASGEKRKLQEVEKMTNSKSENSRNYATATQSLQVSLRDQGTAMLKQRPTEMTQNTKVGTI